MTAIFTATIDHPLDPENAYLTQAAVGAPEPLTLTSGTVTLGQEGSAVVHLPAWFAASHQDVRYQLTPIGAPAPALHIAQELRDGQFTIAGGRPGLQVSWQVSGVRCDAYIQAHPLVVEASKPAREQGSYLHPEEYGQTYTKGREYARLQGM